jgi:stalled ribosome rescue protein Dom34
MREIQGPDDDFQAWGKRAVGGSMDHGDDHVAEHRKLFANEAAAYLDQVLTVTRFQRLVLAGDETAVPILQGQLTKQAASMVRAVLRIDRLAKVDDVEADVLPELERLDDEDARDAADRLETAAKGSGLGVGGLEATRSALELGQALEVLLSDDFDPGHATLDELIRRATLTDAPVTFVSDHQGLRSLGGVGALLRFSIDGPPTTGGKA